MLLLSEILYHFFECCVFFFKSAQLFFDISFFARFFVSRDLCFSKLFLESVFLLCTRGEPKPLFAELDLIGLEAISLVNEIFLVFFERSYFLL